MSSEATVVPANDAPRRGPSKLVMMIVAVVCTAAGAGVPWVVSAKSASHNEQETEKDKGGHKDAHASSGHGGGGHGAPSHGSSGGHGDSAKDKDHGGAKKTEAVPFGEVIVNLHEERMTRYLRVKIVLEVDSSGAKAFTDELEHAKPGLKSWLIGHLSGKSLKDVGGSIGVKRMQREILEHFEEVLEPEGDGPLRNLLFEEYAVQ